MSDNSMTEMRCTAHNIRYAAEMPKSGFLQCPVCLSEDLGAERLLRAKAEQHRDILLQAIDLKRTLVREGAIQAG